MRCRRFGAAASGFCISPTAACGPFPQSRVVHNKTYQNDSARTQCSAILFQSVYTAFRLVIKAVDAYSITLPSCNRAAPRQD
jgi:hypothetical protein